MPNKAKLVTRTSSTSTVSADTIPKNNSLTHAELDSNLLNLRDATFGVASDDSTVIDIGLGNTLKVAGTGGVTTTVSGQTLTITGSGSITIVGDDSTGTTVSLNETFKIAGGNNITTAVSGDILTITGSKSIDVNEINSGDSSAIQINDNVNMSGTLNAKTMVVNDLISEDSTAINVLDGLNVSGTLSADVLDVNELSSGDSSAIQINDALNVSGATTINNTLAVTSTSTFTGDATFLGSITGDTNSPVTIAPDGTGDVHLNADSVRIGDNNTDATIATRGTGDLILTTHEGSGSEGTIRLYDGADGNISIVPNGTGNVELGSQIETTTNFPSAMTSTSFDPTSTRIRGAMRAYSNLSVAPYTSTDDQIIASADYSAIKTNGGTFSSTNTRTVGSDHTINFDLNGSDASALATTGATSVRGSRNQVFYKNTAGGTKTGFMTQASSNFVQIDAGHGGALTVSQINGVQAGATIAANTGETTTVTDYRGFSDTGISTGGTGTTGTNQILTNYYGFFTGGAPTSFGSGTVTTNRPYAFFTSNSVWRSRIGYLDQHRIFGLSATHSSGGAYTIDLGASGSGFHIITLTSNITGFTFTNAPATTTGTSLVRLLFLQDGTGGRTISFTASGGETFLFKNGINTLTDSTAAPEGLVVDIFTRYDGTNTRYYWNIDNGEYVRV